MIALYRLLEPYRGRMLLALTCLTLAGFATLAYPWLVGKLLSGLTGTSSAALSTLTLALYWTLLALSQAILATSGARLVASTSEALVRDLRRRIFGSWLDMPPSCWSELTQGDRLSRLTNDSSALAGFLGVTLPSVLPPLVTSLGALLILAGANVVAAVTLLILALPLLFIVRVLGARVRRAAKSSLDAHGGLFSFAEERLGILPVIKAFVAESYCRQGFDAVNERVRAQSVRYLHCQGLVAPMTQMAGSLALLGLLYLFLAGHDRANGNTALSTASIEDVMPLLLYGLFVVRPLGALSNVYGRYQHAVSAYERIRAAVEDRQDECRDERSRPLVVEPVFSGRSIAASVPESCSVAEADVLEVCGLRFAYPGRKGPIEQVDLALQRGRTLLIHGVNGSGKSTLAWLLLRFLEPDSGTLRMGGIASDVTDSSHWRSAFGYVPQQPLLHNGTLRENILLGRVVTEATLERAVRAANATDLIDDLPYGLDTNLHDRGSGLSGGQQQRIALARAVLCRPRFLILDEATSMLDPAGVRTFIEQRQSWSEECGVVIISHDESLRTLADEVRELREGVLCD